MDAKNLRFHGFQMLFDDEGAMVRWMLVLKESQKFPWGKVDMTGHFLGENVVGSTWISVNGGRMDNCA